MQVLPPLWSCTTAENMHFRYGRAVDCIPRFCRSGQILAQIFDDGVIAWGWAAYFGYRGWLAGSLLRCERGGASRAVRTR